MENEIIETARCPALSQIPGRGADLFASIIRGGWTFIYWPDGVAIMIGAPEITVRLGSLLYNLARNSLEAYLSRLPERVNP